MFAGISRPADNGALWTVISKRPPLEDFRVYSYQTMTLEPLYSLHSFASLFARVHGPVFTLSFAPSRAQNLPWRTFPPSPTGACCDETPVGGEVKHVLDPELDQNSGIGESHIQLLSRHVFEKEKMYEALIVCQVIIVGKRLNCAMECDWNIVLFYFFSAKAWANITSRLTEFTGKQRCSAWTGTRVFFCFIGVRGCDQEVATAAKVAKSVLAAAKRFTLVDNRQPAFLKKAWLRIVFTVAFNVNLHCRMLTHQLWTANLHKLSPWSCWSVASWRYVADFRACSTLT